MYNPYMDYTIMKELLNMYFKTFNKLEKNEKIEILSELGLLYDLSTEKGENALKKEFKRIEPAVKKIMVQKGLYKEE